MSVQVCTHSMHTPPCLLVHVEGGRPNGFHIFPWSPRQFRVCPNDPENYIGLTFSGDKATPKEIASVIAEIAISPLGQEWLACFAPEETHDAAT